MIDKRIFEIIKFSIVGSVGACINILVYIMSFEVFDMNYIFSATVAFLIALINNFVWNSLWTFYYHKLKFMINVTSRFAKYLSSNLISLGVNLTILKFGVLIFGVQYHVIFQILGIVLGGVSNFLFAKYFVFKQSNSKS